jgi:hypothetical protein
MAIHRGNRWTPEEDQRLLELIGSGKSWVLISALLKRSQLSIKDRAVATEGDGALGHSRSSQDRTLTDGTCGRTA